MKLKHIVLRLLVSIPIAIALTTSPSNLTPTETTYVDIAIAAPAEQAAEIDFSPQIFLPTAHKNVENDFDSWTYLPIIYKKDCSDFHDTFSDPDTGWPVVEDEYVRAAYLDDEYQVLTKQGGYAFTFGAPTCDRENYEIRLDARWSGTPGNTYGIVFGIVGNFEQYYLFDMNTEIQHYRLYRRDLQGFEPIVRPTPSDAINADTASNRIAVTREGTAITLSVNGTTLGTWDDDGISGPAGVGLITSSYDDVATADARFDDFHVNDLPMGGLTSQQQSRSERIEIPGF